MQLGVLGVNHRSAPLSLREEVAQICKNRQRPDQIVLSTCERIEIYFSGDDLAAEQSEVYHDLKSRIPPFYEHAFYSYFGRECFAHLACVTAGLDSRLLAETDIQRQVKVAYEESRKKYSLASPLHYLFQKSLRLGKMVRSSFPLKALYHLEGMVFQLVQLVLGNAPRLLFIGNSDINRKIIHHFWRKGRRNMTLCTSHLEPAVPFALDYQLSLKDRSELNAWSQYDGVIAATLSDQHLIASIPSSVKTRLMLDLSVPRSINPALKQHPQLTLLDMEEMGRFFENDHRWGEIQAMRLFIQQKVEQYLFRNRRGLDTEGKESHLGYSPCLLQRE